MANKKFTDLSNLASPAGADILAIVDDIAGTATTKKVTATNLMTLAPVQSVAGRTGAVTLHNDITTKTASFTLANTENGKVVFCNSSSRIDVTIPSGLLSGFNCRFVQGGSGRVRIMASGSTINGYTSGANMPNAVIGQHGVVNLVPTGTDTYSIEGDVDFLFIYANSKSLSMDGVDDRVDLGNITALNSASTYSLSWWEKDTNTNAAAETHRFGADGTSFGLSFYSTNGYFSTGAGTNAYTSYRPSQNAWHNIVVTFGSSSAKIYVDGNASPEVTIATSSASTGSSTGDGFKIGARGNNSKYFLGLMDEYAIFSETLSTAQIANIYKGEANGGSGGTNGTPGDLTSFVGSGNGDLKHWYRFEDNSNDSQGSNNGTLTGTTYSTDLPA
ncbi:MAG: putative concanavalin A-like lectin/glucanases superfamily protein [Prokaryotic dsDNA virus sp.]|nr:MAG: putative concanavalin A-like lectin/glucanases superfamily protein [Prokaryotic dsDNA virus sp.]|tara:strand:+ start:37685 stop:38848 length:1164 start_codon:yes stop_codon:yes gene_type:complete